MGKTILKVASFVVFFLVILRLATLQYVPCANPVAYKLGSIDPRFNLSEEELKTYTQDASQIWGNYETNPYFIYDDQAELTINLSYDERQALTTQLEELDTNLNQKNQEIKPKVAEYKRQVAAFEARLAKLNAEVQYWNSQGGAPEDTYNRLNEEQKSVQAEADRLNALGDDLNQSTSSFNAQVNNFNATVQEFNTAIAQKPEEGLYDPQKNRIDIYFNTKKDELVHTIAHELGHARGLPHVENNEDAMMYPFTTTSTTLSDGDRELLDKVCKKYTYGELFIMRLPIVYARLRDRLETFLPAG